MERIPEEGPVLLVGNHSGGTITPDTIVFTLAFNTYFGVERPFYQLAHNLVLTSPVGPYLRRFGTVAASHENARKALDCRRGGPRLSGRRLGGQPADLGGEPDRLRGSARLRQARARRRRADRPGRLGRRSGDRDLPHPRRAAGQAAAAGQALPPEDPAGQPLASVDRQRRRLPRPPAAAGQDHRPGDGADRPARALRAQSRTATGSTRTSPRSMQDQLDELAAERRLPVVGWDRREDRAEGHGRRSASPGLGVRHRARQLPGLHGGPDPLGRRRGPPHRARRPLPRC